MDAFYRATDIAIKNEEQKNELDGRLKTLLTDIEL